MFQVESPIQTGYTSVCMVHPVKLRAWWARCQGLTPAPKKSARAVLASAGWARSVGSVNPYLSLFSRAGITRDEAEFAAACMDIQELPAARGCTYYVGQEDFALATLAGRKTAETPIRAARKHLGLTDEEFQALCEGVIEALAIDEMDPVELRQRLGSKVRDLGTEGKKRGLSTTMPLALGWLQAQGAVRRVPATGRLDQERYRYALWTNSPVPKAVQDPAWVLGELATAYFRWIGPATASQFQAFAGCSATDARAACEAAHVVSIGDDLLLPDEQLEAWQAFEAPSQPDYRLVASLDSHLLLRRELRSLLEPVDAERMAAGEFGPVPSGHLLDLHSHAILDRGRIVGLWEFDPAKSEIVWYSFVKPDDALRHAVAKTQEFVREVGDARSFSLDSPKSRTNKIELLRSLSAT